MREWVGLQTIEEVDCISERVNKERLTKKSIIYFKNFTFCSNVMDTVDISEYDAKKSGHIY